jgi:mannose-6-phosphate isomerase-like protein (cupin superfamily)
MKSHGTNGGVMQIVRSRRRLAVVGTAAVIVVLIGGSVALASHRPQVGLLADVTTLNEVNVEVKGSFRLKTKGPVRVWQLHLARDGTPFTSPWHTHPGPELIAVNEGTVTVTQNTRRGCVSTDVSAGKAYIVPPGVSFQVTTSAVVDLVATLLLPPDEPMSGPGIACVPGGAEEPGEEKNEDDDGDDD